MVDALDLESQANLMWVPFKRVKEKKKKKLFVKQDKLDKRRQLYKEAFQKSRFIIENLKM